jgi:nucleotide-binding universal stress UspA family protein
MPATAVGKNMYGSILVPTDGSDHAARAAAHAAFLAEAFDATLHLLNVVDIDAEAGPFSAGGVGEEYLERLREGGQETVEETAATVDYDDVRTAVVTDRPAPGILDYVDEEGIDLVVMGTHGRTGVQRYVLGSVAERVVSLADVPVLTVRAGEDTSPVEGYEEILVPTDGSDAAEVAIDPALAVAEVRDARIHAVNVIHVGAMAASPELAAPPETISALESIAEEATERVAEQARDAGLDAVTSVQQGRPAETLIDYAEENDIDLVAMGTAGRTGLSRFLLGSTTERVIRHAEMPVLAVNVDTPDEE